MASVLPVLHVRLSSPNFTWNILTSSILSVLPQGCFRDSSSIFFVITLLCSGGMDTSGFHVVERRPRIPRSILNAHARDPSQPGRWKTNVVDFDSTVKRCATELSLRFVFHDVYIFHFVSTDVVVPNRTVQTNSLLEATLRSLDNQWSR